MLLLWLFPLPGLARIHSAFPSVPRPGGLTQWGKQPVNCQVQSTTQHAGLRTQ
jgi:hypothetical protein